VGFFGLRVAVGEVVGIGVGVSVGGLIVGVGGTGVGVEVSIIGVGSTGVSEGIGVFVAVLMTAGTIVFGGRWMGCT
jgi:hypothetical protein